MGKKKFVRKDMAAWLFKNQGYEGLNKSDADRMARRFIECIQEALSGGYTVELRGLGTFSIKTLPATTKTIPNPTPRNKSRKQTVQVKERKTVHFKPSSILRVRVNG